MQIIGLRAHYDGDQIVLDEPFQLKPDTQLIVLVIPADNEQGWYDVSAQNLARAYGTSEPEYSLNTLKEANADYEAG